MCCSPYRHRVGPVRKRGGLPSRDLICDCEVRVILCLHTSVGRCCLRYFQGGARDLIYAPAFTVLSITHRRLSRKNFPAMQPKSIQNLRRPQTTFQCPSHNRRASRNPRRTTIPRIGPRIHALDAERGHAIHQQFQHYACSNSVYR